MKQFNAKYSGQIEVEAFYQGSYEDAMTKLSTSYGTGRIPDVMQVSDINTGYMSDMKIGIPAEELNENSADPADFDDLIDVSRKYYTSNGVLESVPFMTSQPVVTINPELAQQAGLDVNNPPSNLEELLSWARQITANTAKKGIVFHITPWWFEEWSASAGLLYCSPNNGMTGELPTSFQLSTPTQIETWEEFQKLYQEGIALNVGTQGSLGQGPFTKGEVGMIVNSSAATTQIVKDAEFSPLVIPFPLIDSENGGAIIGGNSLWVLGESATGSREQAAWEFVKFTMQPESQALVFTQGGYLPASKSAVEQISQNATEVQKALLTQLATTKSSYEISGCHSGAMRAQRVKLQSRLEDILVNGADVEQNLKAAEAESAEIISSYNYRAEITKRG